jgi:hypothetical protein
MCELGTWQNNQNADDANRRNLSAVEGEVDSNIPFTINKNDCLTFALFEISNYEADDLISEHRESGPTSEGLLRTCEKKREYIITLL